MQQLSEIKFSFPQRHKQAAVVLMFVGVLGLALAFWQSPERAWINFLIDSLYFLTLALSGAFFASLQYVTGSRWSEVLRRVPEAIMSFIPIAGVLILAVFFGAHALYHWTHHDVVAADSILSAKAPYLNLGFFFARQIAIIILWTTFAVFLRRNSILQDETGDFSFYKRNVKLGTIFILVFAISFSIASFDWIMSLEPHWYSTIFSVYNFSGMFVNGIVVITLAVLYLKEQGYFKEVNENHLHDLGKLVFAFTLFWAYIWFCQLMLIWYGNIPEETIYYVKRLAGDWDWLFVTNFVINFAVPFLVLMPRASKRSASVLKRVCIVLLVGRWLDLYLMVTPGVTKSGASIGFIEVAIALGFAGLFIYVTATTLSKKSLLPLHSPLMPESLHHHQ